MVSGDGRQNSHPGSVWMFPTFVPMFQVGWSAASSRGLSSQMASVGLSLISRIQQTILCMKSGEPPGGCGWSATVPPIVRSVESRLTVSDTHMQVRSKAVLSSCEAVDIGRHLHSHCGGLGSALALLTLMDIPAVCIVTAIALVWRRPFPPQQCHRQMPASARPWQPPIVFPFIS